MPVAAAHCSPAPRPEYQRRAPEKTLLYQTIQEHFATFAAQCEDENRPLPEFVKKEFEAYLRCGILAHGFARVYCSSCQYNRLVPFSCKQRGFCAGCMARRMSETAANLIESVIPNIPTRQWVLSVPAPLRYLMAFDSDATSFVVDVFTKTVFSWLRKKAKQISLLLVDQATNAHPGAITFIQRFGSALDLNVHMHTVFSDGVFVENDSGYIRFLRIPAPTLEEIRHITEKIARRVHRWLEKRIREIGGDDLSTEHPLLSACYGASIRYTKALGKQAGQPLMRVLSDPVPQDSRELRTVAGFNLHVSIPVEADDRRGLERLLRYMGRPPLSDERLSKTPDGNLVVRLKRAWSDGTSSIILSPEEFLSRLVAQVPPPRKNLIRYSGVFAPNARLRATIIPKIATDAETDDPAVEATSPHPGTKKKWSWARLMARVFAIDVFECPRCQSEMKIIAFITDPIAIRDILASQKMPTAPPEAARSRYRAEQTGFPFDT